MLSMRIKNFISGMLLPIFITMSFPAYGVWGTLHLLYEKSKQCDVAKVSVGAVAVASLAYYAYLIRQELASREEYTNAYLTCIAGNSLYLVTKRKDSITITQPWPETRSVDQQLKDAKGLVRHFQKKVEKLEKERKIGLTQHSNLSRS